MLNRYRKYDGIKFFDVCNVDDIDKCIEDINNKFGMTPIIFVDPTDDPNKKAITYSVSREDIIKEGIRKNVEKKSSRSS